MEEPNFIPTERYVSQRTKGGAKKNLVLFIPLIIILGAGIFFGKNLIGSNSKSEITPTLTPTPTEYLFPTETPMATPSVSVSPTSSPTPSPKPSSNPVDKSTGLDRSELTIEVQNGSGVKGVASTMADALKAFGYKVSSIGNASNFDYLDVSISVKSEFSKYLPLLKKDLSSEFTVGSTSADLSSSSSADAVVIIGK